MNALPRSLITAETSVIPPLLSCVKNHPTFTFDSPPGAHRGDRHRATARMRERETQTDTETEIIIKQPHLRAKLRRRGTSGRLHRSPRLRATAFGTRCAYAPHPPPAPTDRATGRMRERETDRHSDQIYNQTTAPCALR